MTTITTRRANGMLNPVHCRSCRALVGQHWGERPPSIYCSDPICPVVPPTNEFEERDGILILLKQTGKFTKDQLAELVGLSRQRIAQILTTGAGDAVPR